MPVQNAEGPHLRNHSGMCIGDCLYVHGGVASNDTSGRDVSNGLYRIRISPSVGEWVDLTSGDSPSLSQHACFGILDRYIAFVGGWNGQARIPGVHTYDTASNRWLPAALSEPLLKGFPSGAGLSAHTVIAMKPSGPKNLPTALIIGREGSLRTQRKAGNVYLLYSELARSMFTPAVQ
ncbi:unnamed protein product [Dicrocoelium dendriticum]|nr:unnamed protein product [Dicrocoelium dendriticum]